ncbi:hypothetical protein CPAST_c14560 [Clostridium pasteurianum DSM 525 = ATCC 6013]|uniref:Uncharacterized protein n=1 Tax=Clostridium pasteurianum DSM 525 = ATCC 6013 TaxID=1262449 RepID=A0A0H3J8W4_CLOPA|nr:hypothetical protein [Clostridium pasteurianum]AJA47535.1 hypothetical protein CPAST_c14560 [Clostridium pasteurianum DSM 525 = ATCC 6013]AJA51523.1 hypothetical protein CLPA_c14560 [Clostridium pasteurianum DSM 525 = ATCC 6013]ELP57629.1 hypothetical protein F502_18426 [Clostridium pasteurianum DSM 525 = ATCC 6013]KRU12470.1 hypothetical protein CP6013_01718 [Clostridium pasteurianum DSM 525 = ATCC 6013]UZW15708.1 hypothetical protein OSC52_07770 [Clostridium pasteurianum]
MNINNEVKNTTSMDIEYKIEKLIYEGKWVKNDIGMGRIQCVKLVKDSKELLVIIVSNTLNTPVSCRVEKIIIVNGEIIVFYDGEYMQRVEKEEKDIYKGILNEREWNIIFKDDPVKKLYENNMISNEKGFYIEMHETLEKYMENGYDTEASKFICKKYNI